MLDIDFFESAKKAIEEQKGTPTVSNLALKAHEETHIMPAQSSNVLELPKKKKAYTISEDCNTLTANGVTYEIPSFYNRKMIAQGDKKTIEMVFISLNLQNIEA